MVGRSAVRSFIAVLGCFFLLLVVLGSGFPVSLKLKRVLSTNNQVWNLDELRNRDRARHGRMLETSVRVANFPVFGSADRRTFGLYFTKVKLGSPPREFNVQIDTGSDILWVSCSSCNGCPESSSFGIPLGYFDIGSSSSGSLVSCSDKACDIATVQITESSCSSENSQCVYSIQYQDGSGASGYYVSDGLLLDTFNREDLDGNSSASIIFGCSNYLYGDLSESITAVDGIFGFGRHDLSVVSQLSSCGMIPKVFSHCLRGEDGGGGTLVLGEILEPGLMYSPFVQARPHYNLNLQSITINGQLVPIDPAAFAAISGQGTMVDSGTTLAYFAEDVYDYFLNSLTLAVSQSAKSMLLGDDQCFQFSGSADDVFPSVSLNFEGSASMILRPKDYLIPYSNINGLTTWCLGFQRGQSMTILGDLVLKDKIVVYDLARQHLGWVNYDCSLSLNVSVSDKDEYVTPGAQSVSSSTSSQNAIYQLVSITVSVLAYLTLYS